MVNDASLKEYYIKLQHLYNNAINILGAIEQSLTTSSPEIEVTVSDTDDSLTSIRIPSYLYLENKVENIQNTIDNLFNIPDEGEAWFLKGNESYKLNVLRANSAPNQPSADYNSAIAGISASNILKDLVNPKTFLRLDVSGIPENVYELLMKKIIFYDKTTFDNVVGNNTTIPYNECKSLMYGLTKGVDYDEYDSTLRMPIKNEHYSSEFKITSILNDGLPWKDPNTGKYRYKIVVDTMHYTSVEDTANDYTIVVNDILALSNSSTTYVVKSINNATNELEIEESTGHATLLTYSENSNMKLSIYNEDYSEFSYIDIPLEENQYIVVFISSLWNNIRSVLSDGYVFDLSTVMMVNKDGTPMLDNNGTQYSYIRYYNEFCNNIGDLIDGISKTAYSQLTNYTVSELDKLVNSDDAKSAASKAINTDTILKVVAINKHLTDDLSTEDLINLHNQKNEINSMLQTCQSNIDQVYSTMLTTDFSQNVTITQESLQEKIQGYYTERLSLQKQLNAVIDNINSKSDSVNLSDTKYRIRGIADSTYIDSFISEFNNVSVIGIDVEYRYKTTNKDTATLTTINNSTFTDWNKLSTIEKDRKLVFNDTGYYLQFDDQNQIANTIKWNQIDIPIQYGEDVVVRLRFKYSVGQPFINLYSPWSDELTVVFPEEFAENTEISTILETNEKDTVTATFNKTLIDEGYTEHIQNKVLSNEQTFFHMPENIYSGFNTQENNLISLKDKLTEMSNDIEKYKSYIDGIANSAFEVYLNYDDNSVLLSPNSINKINIYNTEHITDSFIKKEMNIVIKNTGSTKLSLYSIFPGNVDEHLITSDAKYFGSNKGDYERVPLYINEELDGQYLGQWIYFRQNNPYNSATIYYSDSDRQNFEDYKKLYVDDSEATENGLLSYIGSLVDYLGKDNKQVVLGYRDNSYINPSRYSTIEENTTYDEWLKNNPIIGSTSKTSVFSNYIYTNYVQNKINGTNVNDKNVVLKSDYIIKYEDIIVNDDNQKTYLSSSDSLSSVINKIKVTKQTASAMSETTSSLSSTSDLVGACLYPNLLSKSQVMTDGGEYGAKYIETGGSLSIPIVYEYYVESTLPKITKSIYFDLRNSLISDPIHYMIEITGNYDYTTTGEIYKDIDNAIQTNTIL